MAKSAEVAGDAMGSQLAFQRNMLRLAEQIMRFEGQLARWESDGTSILGMSIRAPDYAGGDYLLVLRAERGGGRFVAFTSSDTLADTLRRMVASLENGSLKWKEDKYADR